LLSRPGAVKVRTLAEAATMSIPVVLLPVFVQVALTFALMFWMGSARVSLITRGQVKIRDIALGQSAWPERETQIANSYHNQFQLPLLLYILVAFALITRKADLLFVLMSWLFVLVRLGHVWVHVSSNHVPTRFYWFLAGAILLLVMWIIFAVRIVFGI
jgi:hypothetical protein